MKKFYQIVTLAFISVAIIFSFSIFVFEKQVIEYLNQVSSMDAITLNLQEQKDRAIKKNQNSQVLDLSILDNDKFKNLKATQVDLTGLKLPTGLETSTPGLSSSTEPEVDFKVGNSNPFLPF